MTETTNNDEENTATTVQVLVRIRPPVNQHNNNSNTYYTIKDNKIIFTQPKQREFIFDSIKSWDATQEDIFTQNVLPLLENTKNGYNTCIFTYGQTGSGKTYTMMGDIASEENYIESQIGIIPRTLKYLLNTANSNDNIYTLRGYFVEIYNEKVHDLFAPQEMLFHDISVRETGSNDIVLDNITWKEFITFENALEILYLGIQRRKVSCTSMNTYSSRSHTIFGIYIDTINNAKQIRTNSIHLVDLAGSECSRTVKPTSVQQLEASNINRSLCTLSTIFLSLTTHTKRKHIPFRESKLTLILRDSIIGNCMISLIATISSDINNFSETLSTLIFANQTRSFRKHVCHYLITIVIYLYIHIRTHTHIHTDKYYFIS